MRKGKLTALVEEEMPSFLAHTPRAVVRLLTYRALTRTTTLVVQNTSGLVRLQR